MTWLVFALLARLLWASTNALDQILSRAHGAQENSAAAPVILYLCFLPVALVCFCLAGSSWPSDARFYLHVGLSVAASSCASLPYLAALRREQAYNITPYLELTPVFLIGFAFLFSHQVLGMQHGFGAALVIVGGFLFSWDFERARFKTDIFLLLTLASFLFALSQYGFSQAATYAEYALTVGLFCLGMCGVGVAAMVFHPATRRAVVATMRASRGAAVWIGLTSNGIDMVALAMLLFAFRTAPSIGHVAALSASQSIFSFLLAVPLARLFPKHFVHPALDHGLTLKLLCLAVIAAGVYALAWA